jgi:hypothetical protein
MRVDASNTLDQWRTGERRLRECPPERRRVVERVEESVFKELRRRLGGAFTSLELIDLYERGTAWCMAMALESAPEAPWAWEPWIADAAFQRYLRDAKDYAGGRVTR